MPSQYYKHIVECEDCGKEFEHYSRNISAITKKFCEECARIRNQVKNKNRYVRVKDREME